jgi:hypothetical protein
VSVSHTTRAARPGEVHGKNYFFVSKNEFNEINNNNDFICKDCGKCLKSRGGLRRHRLRKHLKQEMKFKCTTDSCTAAFCEKGSYWLIRPAMVNKKDVSITVNL